jgi:hypothetical protein
MKISRLIRENKDIELNILGGKNRKFEHTNTTSKIKEFINTETTSWNYPLE